MIEAPVVLDRDAADTAMRLTRSSLARAGARWPMTAFHEWWQARQGANKFDVTQIRFDEMEGWRFDGHTGNLAHESGRFFTIEGLQASGGGTAWSQPIINQPEVGILGILVKEFNGVLHCLMQAKMEPGNVNTLQLSPTVQATRSNYTRVHSGSPTRYLEYFREPRHGRVLVDVLQSEQGAWFWHKRNRNMVVEATGDVPEHEDFCWLTLGQIWKLMRIANIVNMDARTVLACMPQTRPPAVGADSAALSASYGAGNGSMAALHTQVEILSWFTERKVRCQWTARPVPLADVTNWTRTGKELADDSRERFRIMAVRARAGNREVTQWTQPLLAPAKPGRAVFLVRPIDGVLHLLMQARPEQGLLDLVEMAPTIQLPSAVDAGAGTAGVPGPPAGLLTAAESGRILFDALLSEEGGRFYHAQTRYQVIEAGLELPVQEPEDFCWVTVQQLMDLVRHGHYLNVEARSLLACVHSAMT